MNDQKFFPFYFFLKFNEITIVFKYNISLKKKKKKNPHGPHNLAATIYKCA